MGLACTHRVALDYLALGVLDDHYQLRLEGDDQHGALFHHLAHRQLGVRRRGRVWGGAQSGPPKEKLYLPTKLGGAHPRLLYSAKF